MSNTKLWTSSREPQRYWELDPFGLLQWMETTEPGRNDGTRTRLVCVATYTVNTNRVHVLSSRSI